MICPIDLELCRYYYQYQESRLSACPAVLHGMLHIPQNIHLNNCITQLAYLGQLGARYDLEDELRTFHQYKVSNELSRFERDFVRCESSNCA